MADPADQGHVFAKLIVLGLLVAQPVLASAKEYRNDAFGFRMTLPDSMNVCTTPVPAPDHGFLVIESGADCDDATRQPLMELFVEHNSLPLGNTPKEVAAKACNGIARDTRWARGGAAIFECEPAMRDGRATQSYVLVQTAKRPDPEDWTIVVMSLFGKTPASVPDRRHARSLFARLRWTR
ncbi:hypothetical protein [Mitsuaria sp. GD03876]|uniref:hypothetical protein n=1 Tax=Mitsuaria sp. GD03876 TaxID=2975399 RepID=UPI00244C4D4B|nr:hypothetical protein [Mitsuaria sp. GD03876]MDH0867594.1 hypothetical protein [Mitsuaria sp. GD03876]